MGELTLTLSSLGDETEAVEIIENITETSCVARATKDATGLCSIIPFDEPGEVSLTVRVEETDEELIVLLVPVVEWYFGDTADTVAISESGVGNLTTTGIKVDATKYMLALRREDEQYLGNRELSVFIDFDYTPSSALA